MTYTASSLTSANPAADLYTALATALTSAGYTLVDTVVISTRTHKVWKCAAANNSAGLDWYLDVAYTTTGAGSVWLGAFEDYNSTTHLGFRGPYNHGTDSTALEGTYYTRYGATGSALETNWTTITNSLCQFQTQTSAFAYWISVTGDRVIGMTSLAPTTMFYCGFFDMYTPWANKIGGLAFPLITCTVNSPSTTSGANSVITNGHASPGLLLTAPTLTGSATPAALTRRPPVTTLNTGGGVNHNAIRIYAVGNDSNSNSATGGNYGSAQGLVDLASPSAYFDSARGGRLSITSTWTQSSISDGYCVIIGLLKDIAIFAGSAVTRGDTVTISSDTWVLSGLSTSRCYGFKAI